MLFAVAANIYSRMLNRLKPHINLKLRINQTGFRTGRPTIAPNKRHEIKETDNCINI